MPHDASQPGASVVNTAAAEHGGSLAFCLFRYYGCGVGPPLYRAGRLPL